MAILSCRFGEDLHGTQSESEVVRPSWDGPAPSVFSKAGLTPRRDGHRSWHSVCDTRSEVRPLEVYGDRQRPHVTSTRGGDVLGLTPHGWTALVLGVLVALAIAFAFTRE